MPTLLCWYGQLSRSPEHPVQAGQDVGQDAGDMPVAAPGRVHMGAQSGMGGWQGMGGGGLLQPEFLLEEQQL